MRFILYFLLLAALPALADQDSDFLAAHDAFLSGDTVKLGRYAQRLKNTPLEVYVSYYQLQLSLDNLGNKPIPASLAVAMKSFLSLPEDTPIIDQLRGEWLKLLGKQQRWDLFDAEYPRLINEDAELTCYALQSRRRAENLAALREARQLWFNSKSLPDNCGILFEAALSSGIINDIDIRHRLRLALEANNALLAIKLAELLDDKYAGFSVMMKSAAADPDRYLKRLITGNSYLEKNSGKTTSKTRINTAFGAQVSIIDQITPSENPQSAQSAASNAVAPPSSGRLGWDNILSRLGLRSRVDQSLTIANQQIASPSLISNSLDAACEGACVDMGDDYTDPPKGWHSKLTSKGQRMVALFALERLAKQSTDLAAERWLKLAGYFPTYEQRYFYGRLAYQAARNLDTRALQWYKEAANTPLDDNQSAWKVRAALRAQDWPEVLASINAMSEQLRQGTAWQYWKARALQALGKSIEAREIFARLSSDISFYGQLASAELADSPVMSEAKPAFKPNLQVITEISAVPGVQRTLALYRMGMRSEALEEWRWVLRDFNDRELLTAAEIARRNEMYDRAIGAADKTVNMHDFSLRYLAPYRSELQEHIREQGLDEAWVYGLMRQESRFATGAKSGTGASGLMQIMPSTARWVANKLGIKSYRKELIHQLDTNLRIGTYYMKSVLSRSESNPVLASAAYNAGPFRALQWRGDKPLEGAIYAETIPYEETRDYVEKVMSNTVYYADQFGDPHRTLKQLLGIVPARNSDDQQADPDVP
jgi:soluble lytic murein transglycosylase-like protein